jgi:hypothetical protein
MADLGSSFPPAVLGPAPPPPVDALSPAQLRVLEGIMAASGGIDWGQRGTSMIPSGSGAGSMAAPGAGQSAGPSYGPLADMIRSWGVQQDSPWQNLAMWASQPVGAVERGARNVGQMAVEATGIPAAGRAGQAAAEGNWPSALAQGAMALPGRATAVPGLFLSEATAAPPDPRVARLTKLDQDLARAQEALNNVAARQPRVPRHLTGRARAEAEAAAAKRLETLTAPYTTTFQNLTAERKRLQDELDDEFLAGRQRDASERAAAEWARTPTAVAHPWVQYGSAGLGALGSGYLAFRGARRPVVQFNERVQSIVDRQKAAIAQANDATLPAATRNQARRTAQQAEADYQAAIAAQPHLRVRDRLGTGALSGGATDIGLTLPAFADYVYSSTQPDGGELHNYALSQLNPIQNPGRFGAGFVGGGLAGMLGQEIGEQFPGARIPPSLGAETAGLPGRYSTPRKPAARKRK